MIDGMMCQKGDCHDWGKHTRCPVIHRNVLFGALVCSVQMCRQSLDNKLIRIMSCYRLQISHGVVVCY